MAINVRTDDVISQDMGDRDDPYKYSSPSVQPYHSSHQSRSSDRTQITMPAGNETDNHMFSCEKMSSVRRTFCLFVTFDLSLMFILWVIYTQLIGETGWKAFEEQVKQYNFKHSLFDTVLMSAVRFTFLLLAYALFRIRHWWTVALTTFLSSVFLLTKVFMFDFNQNSKNPLSYCLLIISFVLAWVETWFLDFNVLPQEKKERESMAASTHSHSYGTFGASDRRRLLPPDDALSSATFDQYYSPVGTPEGSDAEDESAKGDSNRSSLPQSQIDEYRQQAKRSWQVLCQYLSMPQSDWKHETGKDPKDGIVYSFHSKEYGKFFKLEAEVDMDARTLWQEMVLNINNSPSWNPTLIECSTLYVVDDCTDVTYNVAAGVGGVVSSRDFVNLRHWGTKDGMYLSAGTGVTHPDKPPVKKHVRGFNHPGGWAFKPIPGQPKKCSFIWIMNTDIKGWIPQRIVDQASTNVLLDYLKYLRQHAATMTPAPDC